MLEGGVDVFAHAVARDVELDLAAAVLHGGEAGLAHHALEHHAPGEGDLDIGRFQRGLVGLAVAGVQVGRVVGRAEIVGIGDALLAQRGELLAALGHDLVVVLRLSSGCGRSVRFGHDDCVGRVVSGDVAQIVEFGRAEIRPGEVGDDAPGGVLR